MVSLSDAFKSQVVIKQTAQGVPKQDIKKLDLIEITISRRCIVPTSLDVLVILSAIALQNVNTAQVLSKQPSIYLRIAQSKEDTSQVLAIFATCQNVCGGGTVFNLQWLNLLKKSTLPEPETMRWLKKALCSRLPAFQSRASQCNCASLHPCNLSTRTARHGGKKSKTCNQCDYASSEAGHLRTHIRRRTVEKSDYSDSCRLSFFFLFAARKKYIRVWALSC